MLCTGLNAELQMKLIGSLTSPYVRKVRVVLIEKNLAHEFVNDPPWAADSSVPQYNPLGKVPALLTNSGETLFDSNILLDYIEQMAPAPALLPLDKAAALQVKQLVILADGILDAGVAILLEGRRPADKQYAVWVQRQQQKIERGLIALETRTQGKIWLHGTDISAADIAVGCMLLWLDFRMASFDWRARHPSLHALAQRLAARPSFQQTVPVE
jgi:glutathione S-transferase